MSSFAELDKRCITFTIHLDDPAQHEPLCRTLFGTIEAYFTKLIGKKPNVSHCGLFSALDVNGSKFSGADRDLRQVHCHGGIFVPHGIAPLDLARLLEILRRTALTLKGVKIGSDAILFKLFDRHSNAATLADYTAYALKEAVREETIGNFSVILPFDDRGCMNGQEQTRIERRQQKNLRVLRGQERFKVYRSC